MCNSWDFVVLIHLLCTSDALLLGTFTESAKNGRVNRKEGLENGSNGNRIYFDFAKDSCNVAEV